MRKSPSTIFQRKDPNMLFSWATIQGSVALQGAFIVAFKQLVPEHTVTILRGLIRIRVKHFPAIFLVANTTSGILFGTDTALVLAWLGFLTSWTYIRFYKKQPDLSSASTGGNDVRGDASETFAFAYFWPDAIQPPVATVADSVVCAFRSLFALIRTDVLQVMSLEHKVVSSLNLPRDV